MKTFSALFGAAALVISAGAAHAGENIKGVGSMTCGQVSEIFVESSDKDKEVLIVALMSWAQGMMSGANATLERENQRDLEKVDFDYLADELLAVCDQQPDENVYDIALEIFFDQPFMEPRATT